MYRIGTSLLDRYVEVLRTLSGTFRGTIRGHLEGHKKRSYRRRLRNSGGQFCGHLEGRVLGHKMVPKRAQNRGLAVARFEVLEIWSPCPLNVSVTLNVSQASPSASPIRGQMLILERDSHPRSGAPGLDSRVVKAHVAEGRTTGFESSTDTF